jgi:transposase InsO family protein
MSYTKNPYMPKVRRDAAAMVHRGHTPTEVGRRFGVSASTVCKWVKKAKKYGYHPIPTLSSRPKRHPRQISRELEWKIFHKRLATKRCAEVVHAELNKEGIEVSLSSVKRTLDRTGLLKKRSPWKRVHPHVPKPVIAEPGALVELDTIHLMVSEKKRIYVYVLIDVFSRWGYAKAYDRMNGATTVAFFKEAESRASFRFAMVQTDRGPEFSSWFVARIKRGHRYTRIGKPNDNAHVERFNRTIQDECLDRLKKEPRTINRALRRYLAHYNTKRLHLGIGLRPPQELLKHVQAID